MSPQWIEVAEVTGCLGGTRFPSSGFHRAPTALFPSTSLPWSGERGIEFALCRTVSLRSCWYTTLVYKYLACPRRVTRVRPPSFKGAG